MKKIVSLIAFVVIFTINSKIKAQVKVVYVNVDEITLLMPKAKTIKNQLASLNTSFKSRMTELRTKYNTKLQKFKQEFEKVSGEKNNVRREELSKLKSDLKRYEIETKNRAEALHRSMFSKVQTKVISAIKKVASDYNYTHVIHVSKTDNNLLKGKYKELLESSKSFEQKVIRELGL